MELGNLSNMSVESTPPAGFSSCAEYKANLTGGLPPYQILVFLNPVDNRIWTDRNEGWMGAFKVYVGLLGSVYLLLGLAALILLIKKDCVRLSTKTFFAVYTTIAILGFSRALLLALDPYDILGFISDNFPPWIIVTRILGSLGFPSLVASYTLMVFTLLKIAKANPGKQWYHKWRYVVPIVVLPYVIAIGAEVIGYLAEYPGLLSVIICEMTFALWGVTVCITYLIAGSRLMHQLRKRERNTVRMSGDKSTSAVQKDFAAEEYERHHKHNRRTARKIAIITYGTVLVAFVYSLFTCGNIIMVCLFVFKDCLGFMGVRGNSIAWLVLHIATRTTEIVLTVIMLYSITDVSGVMKLMSRMLAAMFCCKKLRVMECSKQARPHPLTGTLYNSPSKMNAIVQSPNQPTTPNTASTTYSSDHCQLEEGEFTTEGLVNIVVSNSGDSGIQIEATESVQRNYPSNNVDSTTLNNPRSFLLNASSGESSSSIESTTQPQPPPPLPTIVASQLEEDTRQLHSTSGQCGAPLQLEVAVQMEPESSERHAQAELYTESQDDLDVLSADSNSNLIDSISPVHTLEYTQTVSLESERLGVELTENTGQAEAAPRANKPVPKPRKVAPKSRERREKLHEMKQLSQTSISSLSSKMRRKQTV